MLDKTALIDRAIAWQRAHPPITGYTERVFRQVCAASLPVDANLLTQVAAQYTGREETGVDAVHWDVPETRLPYSNTYRFSLDRAADCSSFWYCLFEIFFGLNVGTWTEEQYARNKDKAVPWSKRRVGDLVLWNFKTGRNASHVACIMGDGLIGHTTSPGNPFRFEPDSYAASRRVGVYRVLSDAQYQSLFVQEDDAMQAFTSEQASEELARIRASAIAQSNDQEVNLAVGAAMVAAIRGDQAAADAKLAEAASLAGRAQQAALQYLAAKGI